MPDKGKMQMVVQPIAYNITFCDANGTRSDRPNGGLYVSETDVTSTLTKAGIGTNVAQPIAFSGQMSNPQTDVDMTQTLQAKNPMAVCLGGQHPNAGIGIDQSPTLTNAMGAGGGHIPITNAMAVRRLTPKECERLQGFPDNYTDIKLRGKETPDGPRYKALGNSMAVPVMRWIGQRIEAVDRIK
jgi:site-specific DNA-cytosine methylase